VTRLRIRQALDLELDSGRFRAYLARVMKALDSPNKPRAVGYCRVSSRKQADEGHSLEAQRDAIIREAVLGGFDLVDVHKDGGISGGKTEDQRPGLAAALEAIRSGSASTLIVKHADRLARDSDLAGYLRVQVRRAGGQLIVIDEAKNDPIRNAVDKMLAELERIRGSQRMRGVHAARRAKGLPSLGPAPYGFQWAPGGRLEAVAAETPVLEQIASLRRAGHSLRAIASSLNAERIPTRSGRPWNPQTVNAIVRRGS
jgi:DNA invertase Pin-like site-specific DNA recombinase